ncbi:unnamed protein product [Calicophoron daubneyi]|uniref:Macro domain-containing protein n=1 Tax=Calicophoron daubneyi TaxID=300641 RepID=A0AAV2TSN6_CALDB
MVLSKSSRSGLVFPVGRILKYMKRLNSFKRRRISPNAAVYLTAVLEYLTREVTELAGDVTLKDKRRLMTPRHIMLAVVNDVEIHESLKTVTFPFSGVMPKIESALCRPRKRITKAASPRPALQRPKVQRSIKSPAHRTRKKASDDVKLCILSERQIAKNTRLCVVKGSVTTVPGSVVVHPTNSSLTFGGQVGRALLAAGGPQLQAVVNSAHSGSLGEGGVCVTPAVGLASPFILHCNSPSYNSSDPEGSTQKLSTLIEHAMVACDSQNFEEIVMPSVGSGGCGFPKELASRTILRAIKTYCDLRFDTTHLKTVYFVLYDKESIDIYTAELGRLQ